MITRIKTIILSEARKVDFKKELSEIEERIKDIDKGKEFILADLFTKSEWEKKNSYKKVLGKLFKARVKGLKEVEEVGKSPQGLQIYKKIK